MEEREERITEKIEREIEEWGTEVLISQKRRGCVFI